MLVLKKIFQILTELFHDRRLLLNLTQKDLKRKFAGSVFGMFWALIQPLMTILVYWFAFQYGFQSADVDGIPFIVWFLAGIVPWLFISESISTASSCFIEYSYLVKKVVFHIDILPMTKILSSLFIHLFFLCLVQFAYGLFGIWPTWKTLQIGYYVLCAIAFTFSISLIFSSVIVFFRDLGQIISVILLAGMWLTPVAWNIDYFSGSAKAALMLNPLYYIIEGYRDSLIGREYFFQKTGLTLYFWMVTVLLLSAGTVLYNRLKPHFADVL